MSGDRVERGASSPAPRRPSQLLRPGSRQDPADDLPQALAVACGLQAEPPPPTQQPTSSSRDFVPNPAPSHRRLPEIEAASGGASFITTPLARHQNALEMNAGHENRIADSSATAVAAAASSSRARSGSASIRSDLTGAASTAMASSPDADADEAASATGGPNRSSLFLPPFENLEVPGADSTHR